MEVLSFAIFVTKKTVQVSRLLTLITLKHCCTTFNFYASMVYVAVKNYMIILVTHELDLPVVSSMKTTLGVKCKVTTGILKCICVLVIVCECINLNN